ncbi:hypothetical protein GCM10022225_39220 [Plantactinospora mayteni]|uniref:Uncharacterized protein n=1 Tax=Plantactinospora mayteni TaxID=566021 RepID=A0ABQ4EWK8_9ACTN|nr:hypothetical protein [Plantactinospora mayteni]GIG99059.1 hypothetical protein Pma05_56320 [Plantactinospora mayteni]
MSDRRDVGDLGSSVLVMMAASGEPVDAEVIARWLGLAASEPVRLRHLSGMPPETREDISGVGPGQLLRAVRRLFDVRLSASLVATHGRIADHYLALWGGLEDGLPLLAARPRLGDVDGGYGLRHLVRHLLGAGRSAEVHRLLACEQPAGQGRPRVMNVWFDARHRAGQVDGYLQDLEAARRLAREATDASARRSAPQQSAPSLGLEMRYTLMRVCAGQADRSRGSMAITLLEAGLWDDVRALNDARRLRGGHRARILLDMLPHLPTEQRPQALHEAVASAMIANERSDPSVDDDLLTEAAALLSPEGLRRAVEFAAGLEGVSSPIVALTGLAPHLPAEVMGAALTVARLLPADVYRSDALEGLAPFLNATQALKTLPTALAMPDPFSRASLLIALIPRLPEDARETAVAELGPISPESLGWRWTKAVLLLPARERQAAIAGAARSSAPDRHVEALAEVAEVLPPNERHQVLADALALARTIPDREVREPLLVRLARILPAGARQNVLTELLSAARALLDEDDRASLLIEVVELMPPEERTGPLEEAVELARTAENASLIIRGAALLPADHPIRHAALAEALRIRLENISYENYFAYQVLDELCPVLPDELMAVVVNEIRELDRPGYLGRFLSRRAEHLSGVALDAGLAAARSFVDPDNRAGALAALSGQLPPPQRQEVLEEALTAAREARRGLDYLARLLPSDRRRALLMEEMGYWRDGFLDSADEAFAGLPNDSTRPVPFEFSSVPVGETWGLDKAVHAVLLRAQRAWRRGEGRAKVLNLIRTALDRYRFVEAPGSPALASAARDLGGPVAEHEYRAAVRDIYRWWN